MIRAIDTTAASAPAPFTAIDDFDAELQTVRRDIRSMIGMRATMGFTAAEGGRWERLLDHELRLLSQVSGVVADRRQDPR